MDTREWSSRLSLVMIGSLLVGVSLVGRLFQKSVIEHESSLKAATSQYAFREEITGKRGAIFVNDAMTSRLIPLAQNERRFQVSVVPRNVKKKDETVAQLAKELHIPAEELKAVIQTDKRYAPPIKRGLTRQQADAVDRLNLVGVYISPERARVYPEKRLASHVVGFVNAEGKGNYGIEGEFDSLLRGSSGYRVGEKDNRGQLITIDDQVAPKDGADIVLTLDRDIQFAVEKSLEAAVKRYEADSGSVVIADVTTGAIVAMAAFPAYDPNTFNTEKDPSVFINPTVSSVWEPGSIAKPLIMALAIDRKLVEPDTKETFAASVKVLNHEIFTAEKKAFGEQTMTQVLENSDNVGMVWVAQKLGNDNQHNGLKQFGFGDAPAITLPTVAGGVLPELKTWNDLTRANTAFGQGFSTTPLQMVMAYAAIANNGKLMTPYVVEAIRDDKGVLKKTEPKIVRQVVSPDTAQKLSTMLESVVRNGHAKRAGVAGYRVGAKTGTAQVPNPQGGYFDDRHIGSLAGIFPLGNPRWAMVVKLDQPKTVKFAESSAGPTFGEIAKWILTHKQVTPDG